MADVAVRVKRPPEEVEAWEFGTASPTYSQLERLAYDIYKRPLAVFFLPVPPDEVIPSKEFRTLPTEDLVTLAANTHLHIRRAHAFQIGLRELYGDYNPSGKCIWRDIALSQAHSVVHQAKAIREYLDVSLEAQVSWKDDEHALKEWRSAVENKGIFVFKDSFQQREISGFCLVDSQFPLIYLNNSTTKTRQIFSLLHELAHLLLSINGLSKFDQGYVDRLPAKERQVERFCNAIAAETLIPSDDFSKKVDGLSEDVANAGDQLFADLAARYGVSREAILRQFLDLGRVSAEFYGRKAAEWAAQLRPGKRGGDWYASKNAYLSAKFASDVIRRHYENRLTLEQAADLLGIKPRNFSGLEQRILQGVAS